MAKPESPALASVEESCWDKFYAYSLLLWDGLGFFGFATSKLGRLRGEKVTFLTQLQDVRFVILNLAMIVTAVVIVTSEVANLNK